MKQIIENIVNSATSPPQLFANLISKIRPSSPHNVDFALKKIALLKELLNEDKQLKKEFSKKLVMLIGEAHQSAFLTQINLLSRRGLFSELRKRTFYKILPDITDDKDLSGILNIIFYKKTDWIWISEISTDKWADFLMDLGITPSSELPVTHFIVQEILNDIYILSQVITSLSIDKNIAKNFESVLTIGSPFMQLHERIGEYIEGIKKELITLETKHPKYNQVMDALNVCALFIDDIKQSKSKFGTSLELTLVLQKINNSLDRMHDLLHLLVKDERVNYFFHLVHFIKKIVKIENQKNSIRKFFNDTISLLAYQMTEHSGKTGEHYVTSTAKEYFQMFYDALKAGFVVGFMVIIKYLINALRLPLFQDTILKSLNYSLGFVGIHIMHGIVATKQPSMTAATIAHSIEGREESEEIRELGEFIIKVFRSQFIAVIGNLALAFPIAFILSWSWHQISGNYITSDDEALHKITSLNPFNTLCILHAAIAGVMLFLSGTLSGVADNANIYNKYFERIKMHRILHKLLGKKRTIKLANYVENNLGSLTGNFTLGFFLAFVAFFGFILGLPLDIQHVSFATGNLGLGLAPLVGKIDSYTLLMAILGIVCIGVVNIVVSFSLAMIVAIKSRGIKLTKTASLLVYLLQQFFKRPLIFFFPPK